MVTMNKDMAVWEWAKTNPFLTDTLLYGYLRERAGSCCVAPADGGETVVKTFVDDSVMKRYAFAFSVMFNMSDSTDDTNVQNLFELRKWQNWVRAQERAGNYPDFGPNVSLYELKLEDGMPQMVVRYENGMAKYTFTAALYYKEGM